MANPGQFLKLLSDKNLGKRVNGASQGPTAWLLSLFSVSSSLFSLNHIKSASWSKNIESECKDTQLDLLLLLIYGLDKFSSGNNKTSDFILVATAKDFCLLPSLPIKEGSNKDIFVDNLK